MREPRLAAPELSGIFEDWLDDETREFGRHLRRCKKIGRLAIAALEYELQASLPMRAELTAASTARELESVLERLQDAKAPRLVRGARPQEHKQLVSLRRDILRWRDEDEGENRAASPQRLDAKDGGLWPWARRQVGWETREEALPSMGAAEIFRRHLSSARASIWGKDGSYLGQGISFVLDPELLTPSGRATAIRSATRCGEQVWRVSAMVVGRTHASEHQVAAEVVLVKRPMFYSRWADPASRVSSYQVGVVGFPASLDLVEDSSGPIAMRQAPTVAHLQARSDISESTFFNDGYADGGSEAFAGQGLFGEYLLVVGPDSPISPAQISDILLKFDYLHAVPG